MFQCEVFILKLAAIDGLATCAIVVGEVSPLAHLAHCQGLENGYALCSTLIVNYRISVTYTIS